MTNRVLRFCSLALCCFLVASSAISGDPRSSSSQQDPKIYEKLNDFYRVIVGPIRTENGIKLGCPLRGQGDCKEDFDVDMLEEALATSYTDLSQLKLPTEQRHSYRKSSRINSYTVVFSDFADWHDSIFGNAFAVYLDKLHVWAYKGADLDNEEGVSDHLRPKVFARHPHNTPYMHNAEVDDFNKRNPLLVPLFYIARAAFDRMDTNHDDWVDPIEYWNYMKASLELNAK